VLIFDSIELAIDRRSIGDSRSHIIAVGLVGYEYLSVAV
jgi:hypothetical protein